MIVTYDNQNIFIIQASGVTIIKPFSFVTFGLDKRATTFVLGNLIQPNVNLWVGSTCKHLAFRKSNALAYLESTSVTKDAKTY